MKRQCLWPIGKGNVSSAVTTRTEEVVGCETSSFKAGQSQANHMAWSAELV